MVDEGSILMSQFWFRESCPKDMTASEGSRSVITDSGDRVGRTGIAVR